MRKSYLQDMSARDEFDPAGRRSAAMRERNDTDYDQRHFVNLLAAAFLLALALCIGYTIKMFEQQQKVEKCLLSGRKDCIAVTQGAPRGMVVLSRHANR
jgi:hypothetical protein